MPISAHSGDFAFIFAKKAARSSKKQQPFVI